MTADAMLPYAVRGTVVRAHVRAEPMVAFDGPALPKDTPVLVLRDDAEGRANIVWAMRNAINGALGVILEDSEGARLARAALDALTREAA